MAMGPRDTAAWAKESILAEIDIAIKNDLGMAPDDLDFDDREALRRHRNRVANLFGLPTVGRI